MLTYELILLIAQFYLLYLFVSVILMLMLMFVFLFFLFRRDIWIIIMFTRCVLYQVKVLIYILLYSSVVFWEKEPLLFIYILSIFVATCLK